MCCLTDAEHLTRLCVSNLFIYQVMSPRIHTVSPLVFLLGGKTCLMIWIVWVVCPWHWQWLLKGACVFALSCGVMHCGVNMEAPPLLHGNWKQSLTCGWIWWSVPTDIYRTDIPPPSSEISAISMIGVCVCVCVCVCVFVSEVCCCGSVPCHASC